MYRGGARLVPQRVKSEALTNRKPGTNASRLAHTFIEAGTRDTGV